MAILPNRERAHLAVTGLENRAQLIPNGTEILHVLLSTLEPMQQNDTIFPDLFIEACKTARTSGLISADRDRVLFQLALLNTV